LINNYESTDYIQYLSLAKWILFARGLKFVWLFYFVYNGNIIVIWRNLLIYIIVMKKLVLLVIMFCAVLPFIASAFDWNQCEKREFVLTAYYSPIEDQAFYYKENFEKEKILNGEWTHWASWKPVFNWMLAWPSSYDFGGKIYFSGLGVGEITDRWWAIVEAGERGFASDRIDIWMWYGEEGLIKAMDFGVQRLEWYYCDKNSLQNLDTSSLKVGFNFDKVPVFKNFFDVAVWKQELWQGRKDIWVYTLQKYLVKLWYLSSNKQTGYFGPETKKAICNYQTKKNISYPGHQSCGIYGPKTRYAMKVDVEKKWLLPRNLRVAWSVDQIKKEAMEWNEAKKIIKVLAESKGYFDEPMNKNTYNQKTERLQHLLHYLWFYDGEINGVYNELTINAVHKYQLDRGLLVWYENSPEVRGYFWPATRLACNRDLAKKKEEENNAILHELLKKDEPVVKKYSFDFYRPYDKNEWPNEEIRILQRFLVDLGLYSDVVSWIYDKSTVDAVFDFQVKYGLLDENADLVLRGFFGPSTRKKMNEMRQFVVLN